MFGYLDPGSGSMLLQLLAGGAAAAAVTARMWWGRARRLLRFGRGEQQPGPQRERP